MKVTSNGNVNNIVCSFICASWSCDAAHPKGGLFVYDVNFDCNMYSVRVFSKLQNDTYLLKLINQVL